MSNLKVDMKLKQIHCFDEGDGWGSAEPYLWTVFFKVDGDTVVVNSDGPAAPFIQGVPTVVGTPGNHGNLGDTDVDDDDTVDIPAIIGEYHTVLRPIPLTTPLFGITEVGGMIGCVVVLMEEDNTGDDAITRGHEALDRNVRDRLAELLGTLSVSNQSPSEEDIKELSDKVGVAVKDAIGSGVSVLDWIFGFGNMDDQIGSTVFRFSHDQLAAMNGVPIPFEQRWDNEGDWSINGSIVATVAPEDPCCRELRGRVEALEKIIEAWRRRRNPDEREDQVKEQPSSPKDPRQNRPRRDRPPTKTMPVAERPTRARRSTKG